MIYLYIIIFIAIFEIVSAVNVSDIFSFHIEKNESCNLGNGEEGCCVRLEDCQKVLYDLINNINPTPCYFKQFEQYVCCPNQLDIRNQSKSEEKCQKLIDLKRKPIKYKKIFGGKKAELGEFPFMAAIGWIRDGGQIDYLCGGVLISKTFILTAAHCTYFEGKPPSVVRVGGANLKVEDTPINISKIHIHPSYKINEQYNDIALIEVPEISEIETPCLWTRYGLDSQKEVTAIGYGLTEFDTYSDVLKKVNLTIFSNQQCSQYYIDGRKIKNSIIESQICAGDPKGEKDTCQGDSGGPILFKVPVGKNTVTYIVGITSFGQICATRAPSVYTRVSLFVDWIDSIIWP